MACAEIMEDTSLARFRTKMCRRYAAEGCDFRQRCQYSHNILAQRRCPFLLLNKIPHNILRYLPIMCSQTKLITPPDDHCLSSIQSNPNECSKGLGCPFAHSIEEILFHPLVYKQKMCQNFKENACTEYYCPFVHEASEKRHISTSLYQLAPSITRQLTFPMTRPLNLFKTYNSSENQFEIKPGKLPETPAADTISSILTNATNLETETLFVAAPYKQNVSSDKNDDSRAISVIPGDVFEILVDNASQSNKKCLASNDSKTQEKLFFAKCIWGSSVGVVGWIPASIMFGIDDQNTTEVYKQEVNGFLINESRISYVSAPSKSNYDLLANKLDFATSSLSNDQENSNKSDCSDHSDFVIPMYKEAPKRAKESSDTATIQYTGGTLAMKSVTTLIQQDEVFTEKTRESLWNLLSLNRDEDIEDDTSEHPYPTLLGKKAYEPPQIVDRQYDRMTLLHGRSNSSVSSNANNYDLISQTSQIMSKQISKEFEDPIKKVATPDQNAETVDKLYKELDHYKLLNHLLQADKEIQHCISITKKLIANLDGKIPSNQEITADTEPETATGLVNLLKKYSSTVDIDYNTHPVLLGSSTCNYHDPKLNGELIKTPTVVERAQEVDNLKTQAISTVSTTDNTVLNCSDKTIR